MKKDEAVRYFGSATELARRLGISKAAVSQWGEDVPTPRDYQIEVITKGVIKARQEDSKPS